MGAGVLSFSDYIGGPDDVIAQQQFPSDQHVYQYNYGENITGWTFTSDCQTVVVDQVSFNRYTGQPNFSNSNVVGTFAVQQLTGNSAPQVVNAVSGTVDLRIPANLYTGPILPDARQNVPVTVVAITWATNDTFAQINTHRWALIQCWEPDVVAGDPTLAAGYTAIVLGA